MSNPIRIASSKTCQPGLTCPQCGSLIDATTAVGGSIGESAEPKPGDLSVCAYCAQLLEFVQSAAAYRTVSVRAVPEEEAAKLLDQHPLLALMVHSYRQKKDSQQRHG